MAAADVDGASSTLSDPFEPWPNIREMMDASADDGVGSHEGRGCVGVHERKGDDGMHKS